MALLIKQTGETKLVLPVQGKFTLEELQNAVGGLIELVRLPEDPAAPGQQAFVVNEEGHLLKLKMNIVASSLAGQIIVGDVLWVDLETEMD